MHSDTAGPTGRRAITVVGAGIVGVSCALQLRRSGHLGMTGAPGTGRLIADLIAGRPPFIHARPYGLQRFDGGATDARACVIYDHLFCESWRQLT
ncbi:hypothetical protein ACQUJS_07750 [Ralstonia pseudosolanacearum]|uniref:Uncharacterized protein n=1 Tax=Ralstonia solanacearum TaxID=305 RepID=A0A0S4TQI5_RALSL|nr:hypothetical protein RSP799_13595 [Ralstonia solanacearum]CUV12314.1 protein of unknown function [Ralstonia solanacearum]